MKINALPKQIQQMAVNNLILQQLPVDLNQDLTAFNWDNTPEGRNFWRYLYGRNIETGTGVNAWVATLDRFVPNDQEFGELIRQIIRL